MCAHSDRVTVAEINDFLSETLRFGREGRSASLRERIAHQQRKAELLSRIADELETPHAHATAAEAWDRLVRLCTNENQDRVSEDQDSVAEAGDA